MGIRTARRVAALVDEMGTPVAARGLIVNRVPEGAAPVVRAEVEAFRPPLLATVPADDSVAAMDAGGMAVGDIPPMPPRARW